VLSLGPLKARDAIAPDLLGVLNLAAPNNNGPSAFMPHDYVPSPADVAAAQLRPANHMQEALLAMAKALPTDTSSDALIDAHIAALKAPLSLLQ
jgi:hypothetical protein